ncbi:hypothetical protein, partial [Streptomyces lunaelactis]
MSSRAASRWPAWHAVSHSFLRPATTGAVRSALAESGGVPPSVTLGDQGRNISPAVRGGLPARAGARHPLP